MGFGADDPENILTCPGIESLVEPSCAAVERSGVSGEQDDLTAGATRLEIAVGVRGDGEGIAAADVGFDDAVTQRGKHVARHCLQVFGGVVKEHRLGEGSRFLAQVHRAQEAGRLPVAKE